MHGQKPQHHHQDTPFAPRRNITQNDSIVDRRENHYVRSIVDLRLPRWGDWGSWVGRT
jgi:hypothetical protein